VSQNRSSSRRYILLLSFNVRLGLPSGVFPSGFPTKMLYVLIIYPIHASYTGHVTLLHLITVIIFCEEYRLGSSSLCSFLHPAVTYCLLGKNIQTTSIRVACIESGIKRGTKRQSVKPCVLSPNIDKRPHNVDKPALCLSCALTECHVDAITVL
jgi:hypothetical protein